MRLGRSQDWALVVLRCAGLFLALTFGRQKVLNLWGQLHSGQSLNEWGMAQFLRHFHFPAPAFLGILATLNESVVVMLIWVGFLTRTFSVIAASGMAVAFYISMRLGEEPLRALLYFVIFTALAIAGPGRFSADHLILDARATACRFGDEL